MDSANKSIELAETLQQTIRQEQHSTMKEQMNTLRGTGTNDSNKPTGP